MTAVLLATQKGHLSVVERLIQLEADVDQKSFDGKHTLVVALEGHCALLAALIQAGTDGSQGSRRYALPISISNRE